MHRPNEFVFVRTWRSCLWRRRTWSRAAPVARRVHRTNRRSIARPSPRRGPIR